MPAAVLTAYEHESLNVGEQSQGGLASSEAARLLQLAKARPGFCTPGHQIVRLAQYAGLVNMGGRVLEVLPKVGEHATRSESRGTFLRMLQLAQGVPLFSRDGVKHGLQQRSLLNVFVAAYLGELSTLVRAGLLRRYRTEGDDLRVIRGRLLISRQASVRGMRPDILACRYDELTVDNPWNQVLRAALHVVRPWVSGVEESRSWLELAAALAEVTPRRDALDLLDSLVPDRQVQHYSAAIRWAGLILKLLSPNLRAGKDEAPELLFDMNRLFEASVASVLTRECRPLGLKVCAQESGLHLAHTQSEFQTPVFRLRPDLVVRDGTKIIAVADTKWTRILPTTNGKLVPEESHVYQMNAYASAYACDDFYLVYPWHTGLSGAKRSSFVMRGSGGNRWRLHVLCLDVGSEGFPVGSGQWPWKASFKEGQWE